MPNLSFLPPANAAAGGSDHSDLLWRLHVGLTGRNGRFTGAGTANDPKEVGLLVNPTAAEADGALRAAMNQAHSEEAVLLVHFLGHGRGFQQDPGRPSRHLLYCVDTAPEPIDSQPESRAWDPYSTIAERLPNARGMIGLILIVDACYSGWALPAVNGWQNVKEPYRTTWFGAAQDSEAWDACLTKVVVDVLERGLTPDEHPRHAWIRRLFISDVIPSATKQCRAQDPRVVGHDVDNSIMYLAENSAFLEREGTQGLSGPTLETFLRLVAAPDEDHLRTVVDAIRQHRCVQVMGAQGAGRSTLAAVLRSTTLTTLPIALGSAVLFLQELGHLEDASRIVAAQLRNIPGYAQASLLAEDQTPDWGDMTDWERLVTQPLLRLGSPVKIVVDGLGEVRSAIGEAIRSELERIRAEPRLQHVSLVLTSLDPYQELSGWMSIRLNPYPRHEDEIILPPSGSAGRSLLELLGVLTEISSQAPFEVLVAVAEELIVDISTRGKVVELTGNESLTRILSRTSPGEHDDLIWFADLSLRDKLLDDLGGDDVGSLRVQVCAVLRDEMSASTHAGLTAYANRWLAAHLDRAGLLHDAGSPASVLVRFESDDVREVLSQPSRGRSLVRAWARAQRSALRTTPDGRALLAAILDSSFSRRPAVVRELECRWALWHSERDILLADGVTTHGATVGNEPITHLVTQSTQGIQIVDVAGPDPGSKRHIPARDDVNIISATSLHSQIIVAFAGEGYVQLAADQQWSSELSFLTPDGWVSALLLDTSRVAGLVLVAAGSGGLIGWAIQQVPSEGGRPREILRVPVSAHVNAVAICPLASDGDALAVGAGRAVEIVSWTGECVDPGPAVGCEVRGLACIQGAEGEMGLAVAGCKPGAIEIWFKRNSQWVRECAMSVSRGAAVAWVDQRTLAFASRHRVGLLVRDGTGAWTERRTFDLSGVRSLSVDHANSQVVALAENGVHAFRTVPRPRRSIPRPRFGPSTLFWEDEHQKLLMSTKDGFRSIATSDGAMRTPKMPPDTRSVPVFHPESRLRSIIRTQSEVLIRRGDTISVRLPVKFSYSAAWLVGVGGDFAVIGVKDRLEVWDTDSAEYVGYRRTPWGRPRVLRALGRGTNSICIAANMGISLFVGAEDFEELWATEALDAPIRDIQFSSAGKSPGLLHTSPHGIVARSLTDGTISGTAGIRVGKPRCLALWPQDGRALVGGEWGIEELDVTSLEPCGDPYLTASPVLAIHPISARRDDTEPRIRSFLCVTSDGVARIELPY